MHEHRSTSCIVCSGDAVPSGEPPSCASVADRTSRYAERDHLAVRSRSSISPRWFRCRPCGAGRPIRSSRVRRCGTSRRCCGARPAERDLQQRQLLEHRHRREGRHPDLQRRRRADAGLHGRRGDEQDHPGRHFRSAGGDRARRGVEPGTRHPDHAGLRGAGLQGLARDRGHLRADLHPQGRQPLPGRRLGHGAARRLRAPSSAIC